MTPLSSPQLPSAAPPLLVRPTFEEVYKEHFLYVRGLVRRRVWMAQTRSALGRVLTMVRAAWASFAAAAGVVVALGVMVLPPLSSSPAMRDPASNIAAMTVAAPAPLPVNDALDAANVAATLPGVDTTSAAATLPASSAKRAGKPRSAADEAEVASLREIMDMAKKDPDAARAALERHKKRFPLEMRRHDREGIEARLRRSDGSLF